MAHRISRLLLIINMLLALLCGQALAADGWTTVRALQVARTNHAVVPLSDTRAFIAGGRAQGSLVISATEIFDAVANGYVAGPPLLTPRESFTMTRLPNGKVLIAGGANASGKLSSAELYDPVGNTITAVANTMNFARSGHTATLLGDGTVLLTGGGSASAETYNPMTNSFNVTSGGLTTDLTGHRAVAANGTAYIIGGQNTSGAATGAIMKYDRLAGTFTQVATITPRADFSATQLDPVTILVAGGRSGTTALKTAQLYDLTTGGVSAAGSLVTARYNHQALLTRGGEVIVSGGQSSATTMLSSCEKLSAASPTSPFIAAASFATARSGHVAIILDNRLLVTGGINGTTVQSLAQFYGPGASNPLTNTAFAGRNQHTATRLADGRVLIAGGYNGSYLASAEIYDPATGTFAPAGNMTEARYNHTATLLNSGKVLITGGYNNSGYLASAELYDPATGTFTATGSMAWARRYHTATLLSSGKVLIAGGYNNTYGYLNRCELYDPVAGTFALTGYMTAVRQYHTATLLNSGKVLITGGYNSSGSLISAELYNPAAGTFSATGSMTSAARQNHTATLLNSGKVLIAGGYNSSTGYLASAELYDSSNGTFTATTGSLGIARQYHTATLLADGKVLLAGGDYYGALNSAELYDPANEMFTATNGSMGSARDNHTATLLGNGTVLITGGYNSSAGYLASAELYLPAPADNFVPIIASMGANRTNHSATRLNDGKVLIAGGYNSYTGYLASAELYDPATGIFSPTDTPMGTARQDHTATLLADGKVLIVGGYNSSGYVASAEIYDPTNKTFTATTNSMATARRYHTATLLGDGRVLIAGGYSSTGFVASAEIYDPSPTAGIFSSAGSMATARQNHTATLLADGRVLFTGGYNGSYLASAELFDPANGMFTTTGSMATGRYVHTATLLGDGRVLIVGGYYYGILASAELYDPVTGTFTGTGSMATGRYFHTAAILGDGTVLIAGGDYYGVLASAELYDPVTGTFTGTGSMATARYTHTATLLDNGMVLMAGGYNGAYLDSFELFDGYSSFIRHKAVSGGTMFSVRLRDVTTGLPISDVTVSIDKGVGAVTTDSNGYAALFVAKTGSYAVAVSHPSYEPLAITRTVAGYRYGLDIYLTPPDLLNITTPALQPAQATLPYEDRIDFTGAEWPYTISRISGQLPSGVFLYPDTGQIAGTPAAPGSYTFMVRVTDAGGWTAEREFTIDVSNPLKILGGSSLPRGTATQPYLGVLGAEGGTPPYSFSISGASWLTVNTSGALEGIAPNITRENFTITLQDALGRTTGQNMSINIDPPLQLAARRLDDGVTGTAYNQSVTASGGLSPYTFALFSGTLPTGLTLDPATGVISGTPTSATRSVFILSAKDDYGRIAYRDYVINIASPLQLGTIPNGAKDTPYAELVKATGGLPPYTWSLTGGVLPAGLTLNPSTGIVSGIPTIAGLTNLQITVRDSSFPTPLSVPKNLTSRIVTTLAITTSGALPNARKGVAINPVVLNAKGGTSPYSWRLDSGTLPSGLSLAGGVLQGTPSKPGDYIFTLAVTDSATVKATETKQFICHVSDTLEIVRTDLPLAAVGEYYSQTFQATGGIPASYSWRVVNGTLPSGLTFNPATATITGTPTTRQSYSFTLEVSDNDFTPQVATRSFVIDVVDSLNIAEVTVPNGRLNEGYTTTLHPLRGNPPYTWRISNGGLPPGLVLTGAATNAQITGKPTSYGIYTFDLEITDRSTPAVVFTRRYTMEVYDTVAFSTSELKTVVRGRMYDETLVVSGGARITVTSGTFDPAAGRFVAGDSMWVTRQDYSATTLPNGKVLVAGGRSGATALGSAELYEPGTKTFTSAGNLRTARYLHTATLLKNGKVLITGGSDSASGSLASAELYDPETNQFTAAGSMNDSRVYHTASLLDDGRVLVTGGADSGSILSSAETFNPATSQFTTVGSLVFPRQHHTATRLADGRVLVAGGDYFGSLRSSVELFDPAANSFNYTGNMYYERAKHSATLLDNGNVLLAGGDTYSGVTAAAEIYSPSANAFNMTVGSMLTPRQDHTATLLNDGTVLLAAGNYYYGGGDLSSAEQYDPVSGTFQQKGAIGAAARYQAAVLLNDGAVFFPGSYNEQYSFSLKSGSLPDGISLDERTGRLSGITSWPAGRSVEATFRATDTGSPNQAAEQTLLFKVVDPLEITTASLTTPQNIPYSLALAAVGGVSPYSSWDIVPTWETNDGSLPPGLALNRTSGVISGTPTACGLFPVRIKVVDSWTKPNQTYKDFQFNVDCVSGNYLLMVQKNGTGSGTVSSSPAGISCGTSCSKELAHNSPVTLTATPATGSRFTGWSGACSGTSASCTFTLAANMTATAAFSLNLEPAGSISATGGSYTRTSPVPLTLSATSSLGAMSTMQFSINEGPWGTLVPYATSYSLALPAGDAINTVRVRFKDVNGNYSPVYATTVTLDTTKPLVTAFDMPGASNSATVPVISFAGSDLNGITGYYIATSATPPAATAAGWSAEAPLRYTVTGITASPATRVLYAFVRDIAGNVSLAASKTVVITLPPQQLSITLQGSGDGTVNSSPAGIACTSGTCSAYFNAGTVVTLMPTPAWNSDFIGWSGAPSCTGSGQCQVTVSTMTSLTAQFDGKPSYLVWLVEDKGSRSFYSITDAFDAAASGALLLAQSSTFIGDFVLRSSSIPAKSVLMKGGFDPTFKQQSSFTVVNGSLRVGKGAKFVVQRLVIR